MTSAEVDCNNLLGYFAFYIFNKNYALVTYGKICSHTTCEYVRDKSKCYLK